MNHSDNTDIQHFKIDACWKIAGIYGDRSCPKLTNHTHCRNCEVYTDAASALRDQFNIDGLTAEPKLQAPAVAASSAQALRFIMFRLDLQWFAIRSRSLNEVCLPLSVRIVPNSRSDTLKGLCNVKGQLLPCLSLHQLFEISKPAVTGSSRMLVLNHPSGAVVVEVDQILEIAMLEPQLWDYNRFNSGTVLGQLSIAAAQYKDITLTLLDAEALLTRMLRELQ